MNYILLLVSPNRGGELSCRNRLPVFVPILLSLFFSAIPALSAPEGKTDLVLIIDTSKSMRGAGGYANIFGRVKQSCKQIVRELSPGDTVTVIAFDSSVKVQPTVTIHGDTEISRVDGLIDDLRADGAWTFTAKALRNALEEAARLEKIFPGHNQAVVILTDGLNDPPPGDPEKDLTLESVAKPYSGKPWYVYQVQLGPKVDKNLSEALKSFPHGTTIHDPRGPRLSELHEKVKPKPKDIQISFAAKPGRLLLKVDKPGVPIIGEFRFTIPKNLPPSALSAKLNRSSWPAQVTSGVSVTSPGEGEVAVRVEATGQAQAPDGDYKGNVAVSLNPGTEGYAAVPLEIPVDLSVRLLPPTWPYWVAGFLAVLVIVAGFLVIRAMAARRKLFGKLECHHKDQPEPVVTFSLEELQSKTPIGEAPLELPGAGRTLGWLSVGNVDFDELGKQRLVLVTAAEGVSLTLDDRPFSELPLFDRDVFCLGDWVCEYRGDVSRRPESTRY